MSAQTNIVELKYKVLRKLPQNLYIEVGKIITQFSYLEFQLNSIIYKLLDLEHSEGWIAVRDPRATDRWSMIRDLLEIKGLHIPKNQYSSTLSDLTDLENIRNKIAHGVWMKDTETKQICLLLHKGRAKGQSRSISPMPLYISVKECKQVLRALNETNEQMLLFTKDVFEILKSLK